MGTGSKRQASPVIKAALWMTGTLVSFMGMAVGGRELSVHMATFQILFFRSLTGLFIIGAILLYRGLDLVRTRRIGLHCLRNLSHFGGQFGWFFGIAHIPLAEVFAIEFTLPVWTLILAAVILREPLTVPRIMAVGLGILGMLVILRPGLAVVSPVSLIVLSSAVCYGLSHTLTRKIALSDHPITILFYMTLVQLPMGLVLSLNTWSPVTPAMWPWLIIVGATALTGHYCMAKALSIAHASVVVPMDFLRLPLIAFVGYLFYHETLDVFVFSGALVMLLGNIVNIRAEQKRK